MPISLFFKEMHQNINITFFLNGQIVDDFNFALCFSEYSSLSSQTYYTTQSRTIALQGVYDKNPFQFEISDL